MSSSRSEREVELEAENARLRTALARLASSQAAQDICHTVEPAVAQHEAEDVTATNKDALASVHSELATAGALNTALRRANCDLAASRAALRKSEERLRLILDSATDYAIFSMDLDRRITSWNEGAERLLGWSAEEIVGQQADVVFTPEDCIADVPAQEARDALCFGRATDERWHQRKDGTRFWANGLMLPLRDPEAGRDVHPSGLLKVMRDETERRQAEERRTLLLAELNHRVKNILATVQGLAAQTLKGVGGDPARFARHFGARLRTLARAHDLLTMRGWEPASIEETLRAALAPWLETGRAVQLDISGNCCGTAVSPHQAQAQVLAFHELATNATKYGALSTPKGRVEIRCEAGSGDSVAIYWTEAGGPPVMKPPDRRGFGTRLLERGLANDLGPGSTVELRFEPSGLCATIRFNASKERM